MPQDIQQQPWSQYFDSGQNFGNWFNQDYNQTQKLKFEQARAIIDDEMQRQRLGQQQQQITQTGDYYKQLGLQHDQDLALRKQQFDASQDKSLTPEDKIKTLMSMIGPQGGQMPVQSGIDVMNADPNSAMSPDEQRGWLSSVAKVQGPSPVNMGVNAMGGIANALGGVPGGPNLSPTELQAPPQGQGFLPGTQQAIESKHALEQQRIANVAWKQAQTEKLGQAMQLAGDAATIKNDLTQSQTALNAARAKELAVKGPWQQWYQGESLKARQAEIDISRMRLQIYGKQVGLTERNQALGEAKQSRQIMSTDLGRTQTEITGLEKERDGLKTAISRANALVSAADQMADAQGDKQRTSLANDKEYNQAKALIDQLRNRVGQINSRTNELGNRASDYRRLLSLLPDQQQINQSGKVTPIQPSVIAPLGGGAAKPFKGSPPIHMKDGTTWQQGPDGKWNKL